MKNTFRTQRASGKKWGKINKAWQPGVLTGPPREGLAQLIFENHTLSE
jgi:hypothetical protein